MKVLVVDDSVFARHRLGAVLREAGHEVVEAEDGETALRLMAGGGIAAATVDLLMPGMDGLELIRRLREGYPDLPILSVSADVQKATQLQALAAGVSHFIAKTDPAEKLLGAIAAGHGGGVPSVLTARQEDALTEIMNLAMGQAADALSVLLNRRVLLKVPEVELMTAARLKDFFQEELVRVGVTVRQRFSGLLAGTAAMVFSAGHAAFLIRALMGIQMELGRLSSAEQSTLTEMGNIVLNAAIAVLANECGGRLRVGLPEISLDREGTAAAADLLSLGDGLDAAIVLVSRLTIGKTELVSYLCLMLPAAGVQILLRHLGGLNGSSR